MPLRPLSHDLLKSQAQVARLSAAPQTASEPDARLLPEVRFGTSRFPITVTTITLLVARLF